MKKIIAQTFETHRSYDWAHIIVVITLLPATLIAIGLLLPFVSDHNALFVIKLLLVWFGVCAIILAIKVRRYPLAQQDRIIKLEMRLRLEKLLPPDEHWQITGLDNDQIISLRFASDEELPTLMHKVLDEHISNRDQIKRMIENWTPDHDRI